jgi:hypothetical protein
MSRLYGGPPISLAAHIAGLAADVGPRMISYRLPPKTIDLRRYGVIYSLREANVKSSGPGVTDG